MALSKKQIITTIFTLAIVFAIPIAVFLAQRRQNIKPRALQGKANFLLSTDSIKSSVGKNIDVLVSLQTTDAALRVSGVDFLLLYDKNRLDVGNIVPNVILVDPKAPFTDAPIVTSGGSFDDTYNFLRVTQIARRPDADLPKGTFQLAKITFRGRGEGQATIKFPDDNKYLEVVGTGTYGGPPITAGPISLPPSVTPGGPTVTTVPTVTSAPTIPLQANATPTLTPVPTTPPPPPTPPPGWYGPIAISGLPGSGSIQASNSFVMGNGNTLMQGIWRGDQGFYRFVPIVNGNVNWNSASGWSGPLSLSGLPGSGSMQSLDDFIIGNTLTQGIWRGDQGWVRTVPVVNGNPVWP